MPLPLHVVITDCSDQEFRRFADAEGLAAVQCEVEDEGLVCTLPPDQLETFYDRLRREAAKAWNDPDREDALNFDSAFFPSSAQRLQPVRQLRGRVAALLARKKVALPPAYASPGFVFGTAEDEE